MAKTQPAVKAGEGQEEALTLQGAALGENEDSVRNPLEGIAEKLLAGREVGGYTLIPAKKVAKNHTVTDTGHRVNQGVVEYSPNMM